MVPGSPVAIWYRRMRAQTRPRFNFRLCSKMSVTPEREGEGVSEGRVEVEGDKYRAKGGKEEEKGR